MNSSINKKSTNNTTIYEDSSNYVMNCDSLSSSFEEIIIETDSEFISENTLFYLIPINPF